MTPVKNLDFTFDSLDFLLFPKKFGPEREGLQAQNFL